MTIEKSVFISYRHTNIWTARAIFQDLRANGYDVFLDYESIGPGDFERIILGQIKARTHFLVLLTPSALENCSKPNDWLRREVETALEHQRNIVPLMFEGFDFKDMEAALTGKMALLKNYQALRIPADFFDEAMARLRNKYLNVALEVVLHPTPAADQSAVQGAIQSEVSQPPVTEKQLSASEYFERAFQSLLREDFDAAIRDCTEAIHLNPNNASAYYRRALAYTGRALNKRAAEIFGQPFPPKPYTENRTHNREIYNKSENDYEQARYYYEAVLRIDPQHREAHLRLNELNKTNK